MADADWGLEYQRYAQEKSKEVVDEVLKAKVYSDAFREKALSSLKDAGIEIDIHAEPIDAEILKNSEIGADILSGIDPSTSRRDQDSHLKGLNEAYRYPPIKADQDVRIVIGRFKNVDPNTIAAAYPLSRYHFQMDEKRTMAVLLDNYYYQGGYVMEHWIQPYETQATSFVADLIGIVVRHSPRKA